MNFSFNFYLDFFDVTLDFYFLYLVGSSMGECDKQEKIKEGERNKKQ